MTLLQAEHLTVNRGGQEILSDVCVSFEATGSTAIIGPNGAGKSTLLKSLAGVLTPTAGRVLFGGKDIAGLSGAARARAIGYLPQQFQPYWDLSVADLVRLGAERGQKKSGGDIDSIVAGFELTNMSKRRWSTLSGGEGSRVLLAMVLASDPSVLLADEPGASLDVRHRIALVQGLLRRSSKSASIVVMHDLDLAFRFFDRILLLNGRRIVADAPPRELIDDRCLDEAFGIQFERLETAHGPLLRAI
ncbi:MAG: ABC transporter ATP-binding protein [Bradyrhizobium sp.]|nr:ABC transporter ATP-binding protein [Bradyrhizobium sp.]